MNSLRGFRHGDQGWQMSNRDTSLGERLAFIRKEQKLSQRVFAKIVGKSRTAYINYENGERAVPDCVLRRVVDTFGTDARWLLTGHPQVLSGEDGQLIADTNMLRTPIDRCLDKNGWYLPDGMKSDIIQMVVKRRAEGTNDTIYDREALREMVRFAVRTIEAKKKVI